MLPDDRDIVRAPRHADGNGGVTPAVLGLLRFPLVIRA
jgi:hypothetical protein